MAPFDIDLPPGLGCLAVFESGLSFIRPGELQFKAGPRVSSREAEPPNFFAFCGPRHQANHHPKSRPPTTTPPNPKPPQPPQPEPTPKPNPVKSDRELTCSVGTHSKDKTPKTSPQNPRLSKKRARPNPEDLLSFVETYFTGEEFATQPRFVVDANCQDAALLIKVFEMIKDFFFFGGGGGGGSRVVFLVGEQAYLFLLFFSWWGKAFLLRGKACLFLFLRVGVLLGWNGVLFFFSELVVFPFGLRICLIVCVFLGGFAELEEFPRCVQGAEEVIDLFFFKKEQVSRKEESS